MTIELREFREFSRIHAGFLPLTFFVIEKPVKVALHTFFVDGSIF